MEQIKNEKLHITTINEPIVDTNNYIIATLNEYTYDSSDTLKPPLELAYTSCFGSKQGRLVGQKIKDIPYVNLGGDGNYGGKSFLENYVYKYFNKFIRVGIGNHERNVERNSKGDIEQVKSIAVKDKFNSKQAPPNNKRPKIESNYYTYQLKDDKTPIPAIDKFTDTNQKNKPFYIINLDSNIFPFLQKEILKDIIVEIFKANKDKGCDIVISLHHAPETYGVRRSDKKDAIKYLNHLEKYQYIDKATYDGACDKLNKKLAQWKNDKENKPNKTSPYSWNQYVSDALKDVYRAAAIELDDDKSAAGNANQYKECRIIGTQSGHDHSAAIMRKKNQPTVFLQGNGSQEGVRPSWGNLPPFSKLFNSLFRKQHLQKAAADSGIAKKKLFAVNHHQSSQYDAEHLRLGYGKHTIQQDAVYYTQYYFNDVNSDEKTDVNIASITITKNDGNVEVIDFINNTITTFKAFNLLEAKAENSNNEQSNLQENQAKSLNPKKDISSEQPKQENIESSKTNSKDEPVQKELEIPYYTQRLFQLAIPQSLKNELSDYLKIIEIFSNTKNAEFKKVYQEDFDRNITAYASVVTKNYENASINTTIFFSLMLLLSNARKFDKNELQKDCSQKLTEALRNYDENKGGFRKLFGHRTQTIKDIQALTDAVGIVGSASNEFITETLKLIATERDTRGTDVFLRSFRNGMYHNNLYPTFFKDKQANEKSNNTGGKQATQSKTEETFASLVEKFKPKNKNNQVNMKGADKHAVDVSEPSQMSGPSGR